MCTKTRKQYFKDSRDGIFGVVTRLQAGRFGFRIPTKVKDFFLYPNHPPRFFPAVKWPGNEVNNSPPYSADVKNEWSYISALPYAFIAWTRKNLPFAFAYIFSIFVCLFWARQHPGGPRIPHSPEVSRSHTTTHHIR